MRKNTVIARVFGFLIAWKVAISARKNTKINENDRICQFRIIEKMPEISFEEVKVLGNEDRGGFGSTGKS